VEGAEDLGWGLGPWETTDRKGARFGKRPLLRLEKPKTQAPAYGGPGGTGARKAAGLPPEAGGRARTLPALQVWWLGTVILGD
jgi:hypothetical protein